MYVQGRDAVTLAFWPLSLCLALATIIVWFPRPQWVTTLVKVSISRSAYRKNSKKKFCAIGTWIWPSVDRAELTQGQTLVGSVSMDIDSKILSIEYLWYNKKTFSGLKNIKYNKWSNIKYSISKYYWVIALYWSQTFLKTKVFFRNNYQTVEKSIHYKDEKLKLT